MDEEIESLARFMRWLECDINLHKKCDWDELDEVAKKEWRHYAEAIIRLTSVWNRSI